MREPKDFEVNGHTYVLTKFPAMAGREIATQYPFSALPKLGDYKTNEELAIKIMGYVGVRTHGSNTILWLHTRDLIDNHVNNWEDQLRIEYAMMEYNCSFLAHGKISGFLDGIREKLPTWTLKILTLLSDYLSTREKQPSENSKNTTL